MEESSKCSIERIGLVAALESRYVILAVNGKRIRVPAAKTEPDAAVGDKLRWNGSMWVLIDRNNEGQGAEQDE